MKALGLCRCAAPWTEGGARWTASRVVSPAFLAALTSLTSCTAIGPTVQVSPGPYKSQAEFANDRMACGSATDQQLQPVATKMSLTASSSQQVAANNQWIQKAYNASYATCMASHGNIVPASAATQTASTSVVPAHPAATTEKVSAPAHLSHGWQLFSFSYHGGRGEPRDINDALWPHEIAHPPAGPGGSLPIEAVIFTNGSTNVMISVANQGPEQCDNGPNDVNATRDYSVCPGKLAIVEGDRVINVRSVGPLCTETINFGVQEGAPDWKDPALWGTRARYDAKAGTIELMTMQGGQVEAACSKTLKVR